MVYEITDENFDDEVRNSPIPCLIEFTAGWCTLCDEMVPVFESLSEKYAGRVKFCIVNTDKQKQLRIRFGVASFPYIVLIRDGFQAPLFDELVSEKRLTERLDFALENDDIPTARPLR